MYFNLLCSTPCTSQKYSYIVYSLYLTLPYHIIPYCTIPYHPLQPVPHHTTCTLPYLIFLYLTLPYLTIPYSLYLIIQLAPYHTSSFCTLLYHTLPSLTACTSSYYLHLTIPHLSVPYCTIHLTIPYSLYLIILLAPYHTSSFCTLLYHTPYHPLQPVPHHTTCTLPYLIFLYLTVPYTLPSLTACTSSYYLQVPYHTSFFCTLLYHTLPFLTACTSSYNLHLTIPHLSVPYCTCILLYPYCLAFSYLIFILLYRSHLYLGHKTTHQLNQIKLDISWHVVVVQMQNNISFLIICQVAQ